MLTSSGFGNSRYAIELTMAANESSSQQIYSRSFKSLDDEHTPGVFTVSFLLRSSSFFISLSDKVVVRQTTSCR